jgi:hypothetical protein
MPPQYGEVNPPLLLREGHTGLPVKSGDDGVDRRLSIARSAARDEGHSPGRPLSGGVGLLAAQG